MAAGALALVVVTGGAAAAAVTFSAPASPSQQATKAVAVSPPAHAEKPLLAVVGASFSAGVGAGQPDRAWPEDLARIMHWRLALSADPGAGYINPGTGGRGPFARLAARLHLARIDPNTIIIQGGHDDIGRPLPLIRTQVESLITTVHRECPKSRLAVLTVFPRGKPNPATVATDQTIVAAARQADPAIIVFDPITSHWHFPRIGDQLHPTVVGHEWIAHRLARGLHADGSLERTTAHPATSPAGHPATSPAGHPATNLADRASGADPEGQLNAQPGLG
jgi:lysophospholipase L1-like esterase